MIHRKISHDDLNKEYVSDSFIKKGSTSQTCCKITGIALIIQIQMKMLNVQKIQVLLMIKKVVLLKNRCAKMLKCSGNENINLNYRCPDPMILKFDSNENIWKYKKDCCRYPEEKITLKLILFQKNSFSNNHF